MKKFSIALGALIIAVAGSLFFMDTIKRLLE